jgi:glycerol-3-phosphate dehydrogenase
VPTSQAVNLLARRYGVDLPVFAAVEAVLSARVEPQKAVALLMEKSVRMDDFVGG